MAAGDLSPDQARYVAAVAAATGLNPVVVTAWVGSESGWAVTKAGHNYLNVGPGRTYHNTDEAATSAAALVNASAHYTGIRAAIPIGPAAQIKAIGESPWGTSGATLTRVYSQLVNTLASSRQGAAVATPVGFWDWFPTNPIPDIGDYLSDWLPNFNLPGDATPGDREPGVLGAGPSGSDIVAGVTGVAGAAVQAAIAGAMGIVFAAAALGLIALGLNRLTGTPARERFSQVSQLAGAGAAVAAL
ncbi:MAG: hypothetical protein ACRDZ3_20830 [Acidimicrobiia bacterium]